MDKIRALNILVFCVVVASLGNAAGSISKLHQKLLEGYDRNVRPVKNHDERTEIKFAFSLNSLSVDDEAQTMKVNGWIVMDWQDEFLVWNPADFEDLDRIHFSVGEIWTPDINLHRSQGIIFTQVANIPLLVEYSGKVIWLPTVSGEVPCEMSLQWWPSDSHTCTFSFGSWAHRGETIDLQLLLKNGTKGVVIQNYEPSGKWKLLNALAVRHFPFYGEYQPVISLKFTVQREASQYAEYVLHSSFAIILTVLSSYGLPLNFHVSRILIHLVCLTAEIISYIILNASLPQHGGPVPQAVSYYTGIIWMTVASFLFTIILSCWLVLISAQEMYFSKGHLKRSCLQLVTSSPALKRNMDHASYEELDSELLNESESPLEDVTSSEFCVPAVTVLRVLNALICLIFLISFFLLHFRYKGELIEGTYSFTWNPNHGRSGVRKEPLNRSRGIWNWNH